MNAAELFIRCLENEVVAANWLATPVTAMGIEKRANARSGSEKPSIYIKRAY